MEEKRLKFKPNTCEFIKEYFFLINDKIKGFCPNCFNLLNESKLNKHFITCSFKLEGKKFQNMSGLIISKIWDDFIFKGFLKKFNRFVKLNTDQIKEIPYNKNYEYWILQYYHPQFKTLLMGLACIRLNQVFNRYCLSAIIIFPESNRNRGIGKGFIRFLNEYYKKYGNLIIESPNVITEKIAKDIKIEYYFHP